MYLDAYIIIIIRKRKKVTNTVISTGILSNLPDIINCTIMNELYKFRL